MSFNFPSPEWVAEFARQINASPAYKDSSLAWEEGPIALLADDVPDIGQEEDVAIWLDLLHGECREARLILAQEADAAPFVIRGTYALWKQILLKEIDPVKALLEGKLKVRGNMATIMRNMKGAQELVECAVKVPTQFFDQ